MACRIAPQAKGLWCFWRHHRYLAETFIESSWCPVFTFISAKLEFLGDQFWGQPYSWFLLMIFPMRFYQEYGSMQMTPLSIPVLVRLVFLRRWNLLVNWPFLWASVWFSSQSNADILTVLSELIYNPLDAAGETRAIALDILKVFNKVWHAALFHKLKAYGVVGPLLSIVESFLQECSLIVLWPVFTSLYRQCWSTSRISFGTNLIPGFYSWSSWSGSIKNRDLCRWHHSLFQSS